MKCTLTYSVGITLYAYIYNKMIRIIETNNYQPKDIVVQLRNVHLRIGGF